MSSELSKVTRTILRGLRHPGWFVSTAASRLIPKDPTVGRLAEWKYGDLPRVPITDVFAGLETVDITILRAFDRLIGTSLDFQEILFLAAIIKLTHVKNILEIGTYDGNTALNLAANSTLDAVITTVDLPPDWKGQFEIEVPRPLVNVTDRSKVGSQFKGTERSYKIRQVFGDSAKIDWTKMPIPFDLVFIDGCHFYPYVKSDTDNAIRYLRQDGILVWHDYGSIADVSRVVDETAKRFEVKALQGTRLAVGFMR